MLCFDNGGCDFDLFLLAIFTLRELEALLDCGYSRCPYRSLNLSD